MYYYPSINLPRSPPTRPVSSSARHTCASCRSACRSAGSDSLRSYRSSLCGGRECRRHISSSVSSGGQRRHPGSHRGEEARIAPLAGVRSRYICSEETSSLRIPCASGGTEPPLQPWRIQKCPQVADRVQPLAGAW